MYSSNSIPSFGVVCHDAGAAGQITTMLARWSARPTWVVMKGPAVGIWQREFPTIPICPELGGFQHVQMVITGTGWASDLEHNARILACSAGVQSVALLDHWINYEARFIRNGHLILPDQIWVVDEYAEVLARQVFTQTVILRKPDYYAERELMHIFPINLDTPNILLYLLEPVRSNWGKSEPGEYQALRYFLDCLRYLDLPPMTEIHLRQHPSENADKYASFVADNGSFPIKMSSCTLTEAISSARWVAGCQTYAMTLALAAGRTVFCSLPPWAPACALPHHGLVHLRNFITP